MRRLYLAGWVFIVVSAVFGLTRVGSATAESTLHVPSQVESRPQPSTSGGEVEWFAAMRPYCNAVEVETRSRWNPAPTGTTGAGYSAACFALAGRVDRAREILEGLEGEARWQAAGVVFGVAHPVADAGDDRAAGPVMELVIEFWPNHYMALYHAGIARHELGDRVGARGYLERFLEHYGWEDGFTSNARSILEAL